MLIPTTPNRPLLDPNQSDIYGEMHLRFNEGINLLENSTFDAGIVEYDDNYQNNQGLSQAFKTHMNDVLTLLRSKYPEKTKIVEVGCGKGGFVELVIADNYFEIEGFDGAYEGSNKQIHKRYLCEEDKITADLIVLRHVLEHIKKPHDFLKLLNTIFKECDIYIEVPDHQWIIDNESFFDITYEHVNYFIPSSFNTLFTDLKQSGSLFSAQYQYVIANLKDLNDEYENQYEKGKWIDVGLYDLFPSLSNSINEVFNTALASNGLIYIWGAATKGVMFMHHLKLEFEDCFKLCKAAIDINDKKINKFLPSSRLPIISPDQYFSNSKAGDLIIIANPNYKDEILAEIKLNQISDVKIICI